MVKDITDVITREDLEKEKIGGHVKGETYCPAQRCSRKGEYFRCYFHLYNRCPIFATYWNNLPVESRRELLK